MTGKVVSLVPRLNLKRAAEGEQNFMICPCQEHEEEPSGFYPCVVHDVRGVILSSLVCPNCDRVAYFNSGRLLLDGEMA